MSRGGILILQEGWRSATKKGRSIPRIINYRDAAEQLSRIKHYGTRKINIYMYLLLSPDILFVLKKHSANIFSHFYVFFFASIVTFIKHGVSNGLSVPQSVRSVTHFIICSLCSSLRIDDRVISKLKCNYFCRLRKCIY